MEQKDYQQIDEILDKYDRDKARIITIMQQVQNIYRYLPQDVLSYIAFPQVAENFFEKRREQEEKKVKYSITEV